MLYFGLTAPHSITPTRTQRIPHIPQALCLWILMEIVFYFLYYTHPYLCVLLFLADRGEFIKYHLAEGLGQKSDVYANMYLAQENEFANARVWET